jgi:hypothetical protein
LVTSKKALEGVPSLIKVESDRDEPDKWMVFINPKGQTLQGFWVTRIDAKQSDDEILNKIRVVFSKIKEMDG